LTSKNLYEVLGVEKDASSDQIRKAFRQLSKDLHPDRHPNNESAIEIYAAITAAYAVLSDEKKRIEYDSGSFSAWDDWDDLPDAPKGEAPPVDFDAPDPIPGTDVYVEVNISERAAELGATKVITIDVDGQPTTVSIAIPKGSKTGSSLSLAGMGGKGKFGGIAGNLIVTFLVVAEADAKPRVRRTEDKPSSDQDGSSSSTEAKSSNKSKLSLLGIFRRKFDWQRVFLGAFLILVLLRVASFSISELNKSEEPSLTSSSPSAIPTPTPTFSSAPPENPGRLDATDLRGVIGDKEYFAIRYASYCDAISTEIDSAMLSVSETNQILDDSEREAIDEDLKSNYEKGLEAAITDVASELLRKSGVQNPEALVNFSAVVASALDSISATCGLAGDISYASDEARALDARIVKLKEVDPNWVPEGYEASEQDSTLAWKWSDKEFCIGEVESSCIQMDVVAHVDCPNGLSIVYDYGPEDVEASSGSLNDLFEEYIEADTPVFIETDTSSVDAEFNFSLSSLTCNES
jgi:hypothetical protein